MKPTLTEKIMMVFGFALAFLGPPSFFFNLRPLIPLALVVIGLLITTAGYLPSMTCCQQTSDYDWKQVSGNYPVERKWLLALAIYFGYFFFFCLFPGAIRLNLFCLVGLVLVWGYIYLVCRVARSGGKEGGKDVQGCTK